VGATNRFTRERKEYIPYTELIEELDSVLSAHPKLDFITFSGAGEPTLHSRMGDIINYIKSNYPQYKICLITNSTLFDDEQLVQEILPVDVMLPSLDAVSEKAFQIINRPCPGIRIADIIESMIKVRQRFKGQFWLEIFFVPDINDTPEELQLFRNVILRMEPDQVQLNSLDRPGTENWVVPETHERLQEIAKVLQPTTDEWASMKYHTKVTIIAKPHRLQASRDPQINEKENVLQILSRRPCTLEDLHIALAIPFESLQLLLSDLEQDGLVRQERLPRGIFYRSLLPENQDR
jgi:wyosine [tRNA(Phe)-imidazoG37] synthetase (radical SAM superfamily)